MVVKKLVILKKYEIWFLRLKKSGKQRIWGILIKKPEKPEIEQISLKEL